MQHSVVEQLEFQIKDEVSYLINSSFPAEVVSVKKLGTKQFVDIKPLIYVKHPDGTLDTPFIYDVPVVFMGGGGALFSVPLEAGDTVLAVVSQRCIANWLLGDGSRVEEAGGDQFDLNDCMAIPGLFTASSNLRPNTTDVEIKFKGMSFRLEGGGEAVLDNSEGASFKMKTDGSFDINGAIITPSGDVISSTGKSLSLHTHNQPNDSHGDTQSPTLPPT